MYLENRQELLIINKSNKNDVIKRLGQPHSTLLKVKTHGFILRELKLKGKYIPLARMFWLTIMY